MRQQMYETATPQTQCLCAEINEAKSGGQRRSAISGILQRIAPGQPLSVVVKTPGRREADLGYADSIRIYVRAPDGDFTNGNGSGKTTSSLAEEILSGVSYAYPGAATTETRFIRGEKTKKAGGMTFTECVFDVYVPVETASGRKSGKRSVSGFATEYNGRLYAVHDNGNGRLSITFVPSGMRVNDAADEPKTMAEAAKEIRRVDVRVSDVRNDIIERIIDDFDHILRIDQ